VWLHFGYCPLNVRVSLGLRQAHNLKVAGSNPAPATNTQEIRTPLSSGMAVFLCLEQLVDLLPVITGPVQLLPKLLIEQPLSRVLNIVELGRLVRKDIVVKNRKHPYRVLFITVSWEQ